jgi:hypothetical protein
MLDAAMLRDPFPPIWFWRIRGTCLFDLERYEEAVSAFHHVTPGLYSIATGERKAYSSHWRGPPS